MLSLGMNACRLQEEALPFSDFLSRPAHNANWQLRLVKSSLHGNKERWKKLLNGVLV